MSRYAVYLVSVQGHSIGQPIMCNSAEEVAELYDMSTYALRVWDCLKKRFLSNFESLLTVVSATKGRRPQEKVNWNKEGF